MFKRKGWMDGSLIPIEMKLPKTGVFGTLGIWTYLINMLGRKSSNLLNILIGKIEECTPATTFEFLNTYHPILFFISSKDQTFCEKYGTNLSLLNLAVLWVLLIWSAIDSEAHFGCKQVSSVLLVFIQQDRGSRELERERRVGIKAIIQSTYD